MGRMARCAARLYPKWWRDRYGDEFEALLDDVRPGVRGAVNIAKEALAMQMTILSAKRILVVGSAIGLISGAVSGLMLKPQYASIAVLGIPDGETRQEAIKRFDAETRRILGRTTLFRLIRDLHLYPNLWSTTAPEDLLETMRSNIRVEPLSGTSKAAVQIEFQYPDSAVAQRTVSALAAEFEGVGFSVMSPASRSQNPVLSKLHLSLAGLAVGVAIGSIVALSVYLRRRVKGAAQTGTPQ